MFQEVLNDVDNEKEPLKMDEHVMNVGRSTFYKKSPEPDEMGKSV